MSDCSTRAFKPALRTLQRWNTQSHQYEPYPVPASWDVRSYSEDMDAMVNCAGCGYRLPFGETYTSLAIHALPSGFGYGVCEICHEAEIKRDLRAKEAMNQNERKDA